MGCRMLSSSCPISVAVWTSTARLCVRQARRARATAFVKEGHHAKARAAHVAPSRR